MPVATPPPVILTLPELPAKLRRALSHLKETGLNIALEALSLPIDYVDNPIFKKRDAESALFDQGMEINVSSTSWYHPMLDDDLNASSAPSSTLLSAKEEQHLFLRYNYARMRTKQAVARLKVAPGRKVANEVVLWHRRSRDTREIIINANLALVLAMAKRTRMSDVDFSELISEGNMALLRAVEKFDAARGFKFSTYACRAILKAFSRIAVKSNRYNSLFPAEFDPSMERSNEMELRRQAVAKDAVEELQRIISTNRADLTDVEQKVIEARFAVNRPENTESLTLEEVGQVIGVTKERVRQIQNRALEKLRLALDGEILRR